MKVTDKLVSTGQGVLNIKHDLKKKLPAGITIYKIAVLHISRNSYIFQQKKKKSMNIWKM